MHVKAIIHEEEDGGFWAEVPALPGCATQGDTMDELLSNLREAIEGYLSVEVDPTLRNGNERVLEIAL
jgi:predicted RNase H-like HicB family nuclease